MALRSGKKRVPSPDPVPSPQSTPTKKAAMESTPPSEEFPTSVAASAVGAVSIGDKNDLASPHVSSSSGVQAAGSDSSKSPDPSQIAFHEMLKANNPEATKYISQLISQLDDNFSIYGGTGKVCFSVYGQYVFMDVNPLLVIQVAMTWLDHEKNNSTESEWDPDRILLHTCDTRDDIYKHEDVVGRDVRILPYNERNLPLVAYPAVTKMPAQGSSIVQYDTTIAAATSSPNFAAGSVAALRHQMLDDNLSSPSASSK